MGRDAGPRVVAARDRDVDDAIGRGVPTTTPARTLVELADLVRYATLRRIADRGVRLDATAVRRARARAPNRRGRGKVARLLGDDGTSAREVDHERDAGLVLAGWRVLRFTDAQLDHDAAAVTGRLARAVAAR